MAERSKKTAVVAKQFQVIRIKRKGRVYIVELGADGRFVSWQKEQ